MKAAQAVQQEALFGYEQAIRNGFREFEDALIDQDRTRVQLDAQAKQVEALATYARLARIRYENGYTSYIEVLDGERSLFNGQLTYAQTQDALLRALVNLYKATGGGWVVEADKLVDPAGHGVSARRNQAGDGARSGAEVRSFPEHLVRSGELSPSLRRADEATYEGLLLKNVPFTLRRCFAGRGALRANGIALKLLFLSVRGEPVEPL